MSFQIFSDLKILTPAQQRQTSHVTCESSLSPIKQKYFTLNKILIYPGFYA